MARGADLFGRSTKQPLERLPSRRPAGRARRDVKYRIEQGDCLEVIPRLVAEGVACDACVTDPPYHMVATTERFKRGLDHKLHEDNNQFYRLSKGFMGQQWDGGDVAFRPETWATVASILRPGAFLLACGGTRTYHRLTCAIEDGGFVVQDCVMWLYGSGFPKNSSQLKPAYEPIVLAYKPGGKRTLQVDECRIPTSDGEIIDVDGAVRRRERSTQHPGWDRPGHRTSRDLDRVALAAEKANTLGRWPANLCHDGSDEVVGAFAKFGETSRGRYPAARGAGGIGCDGHRGQRQLVEAVSDSGSVGRFFYTAKASKDERVDSGHPTVKPLELMRWLVRLVAPYEGTVIDPFAGTGSTGAAAYLEGVDSVMIEREEQYLRDLEKKMASFAARRQPTLY